jgi:hypothetical protein
MRRSVENAEHVGKSCIGSAKVAPINAVVQDFSRLERVSSFVMSSVAAVRSTTEARVLPRLKIQLGRAVTRDTWNSLEDDLALLLSLQP